MFLLAAFDPIVALISILAVLAIIVSITLKKFKQPYIIGYILIGIIVGKLGIIEDKDSIQHLGELGIILLMFFIGMEINLTDLVKRWKVAVIGTLLQVAISILFVFIFRSLFDWPVNRAIIIGFVISLSSSAIVIKILQDKEMISTDLGKNVLSILLMQDIIIVPLLIATSFMGGDSPSVISVILMLIGGALVIGSVVYIYVKKTIKLPFSESLQEDHERQVFVAIFCCFGCALFTSLFGLSGALGAFIGGMIMHAGQSTEWIHDVLHSFRVLFVAFFFIGIGLQIDFGFIIENLTEIGFLLIAVYITNHVINSIILKIFGNTWPEAILGGSLLGQIGELSFLISISAFNLGILGQYGYNFTISLISLTMIISPFWIGITELILARNTKKGLKPQR